MTQEFLPSDTRTRILDLMKDRKTTQAALASAAGVSESSLSRFLQGKTKKLQEGTIIKIAKVFNVSTDFLLGETTVPDRKNYDIAELGLSAEAAKLLYTRRLDPEVLNQLLEHPLFPHLLLLLGRYRDETLMAGISSMNEVLSFFRSILLGHAAGHPEDRIAARNIASDLSQLRTPAVMTDTNAIQTVFVRIVHDIKHTGSSRAREQQTATADTLAQFRQTLSKGSDAIVLRNTSEQDIISAILHMISDANVPEDVLDELKAALLKVFTATKVSANDK